MAAILARAAQYQDGQRRHSSVQLGNKRRSADTSRVVSRDNQTKAAGKLGLFNQAKCFRGVGDPKDA